MDSRQFGRICSFGTEVCGFLQPDFRLEGILGYRSLAGREHHTELIACFSISCVSGCLEEVMGSLEISGFVSLHSFGKISCTWSIRNSRSSSSGSLFCCILRFLLCLCLFRHCLRLSGRSFFWSWSICRSCNRSRCDFRRFNSLLYGGIRSLRLIQEEIRSRC